jgi:hypothetical protein
MMVKNKYTGFIVQDAELAAFAAHNDFSRYVKPAKTN